MTSAGIERRASPRFKVACRGEIAALSAVMRVEISDVSTSGCGVELTGFPSETWTDPYGVAVLLIPRQGRAPALMLPVTLTYARAGEQQTRLGLKFPPLSRRQSRALLDFIETLDPSMSPPDHAS